MLRHPERRFSARSLVSVCRPAFICGDGSTREKGLPLRGICPMKICRKGDMQGLPREIKADNHPPTSGAESDDPVLQPEQRPIGHPPAAVPVRLDMGGL